MCTPAYAEAHPGRREKISEYLRLDNGYCAAIPVMKARADLPAAVKEAEIICLEGHIRLVDALRRREDYAYRYHLDY